LWEINPPTIPPETHRKGEQKPEHAEHGSGNT
jgi:hypothetical protein